MTREIPAPTRARRPKATRGTTFAPSGLWLATVLTIDTAEGQDGVAYIEGDGAVLGAQSVWEGGLVTTAHPTEACTRGKAWT